MTQENALALGSVAPNMASSAMAIELLWEKDDEAAAEVEGWNVFSCSGVDDPYRIERVDELAVFAGDCEAWEHVFKLASNDSPLHRKALDFIRMQSPSEYENIVKHVTGKMQ